MSQSPIPVLVVDDDRNVLAAIQRTLRDAYAVELAASGAEAMVALDGHTRYAVVISDLEMPGIGGLEVLAHAQRRQPAAKRMLLSGRGSLGAAIRATNELAVFRYLEKPCPRERLLESIGAAVEHRALEISERTLREETLTGAIAALSEALALVQPAAFARAARIEPTVTRLAAALGVAPWEAKVSALLSPLGVLTLPPETLERLARGEEPGAPEALMLGRAADAAAQLIGHIPKLEGVAASVRFQHTRFDGSGSPDPAVAGAAIPLLGRVLHIANDYDALERASRTPATIASIMTGRGGWYDPALLARYLAVAAPSGPPSTMRVDEVMPGMVMADDLRAPSGQLLVAAGQEVTAALKLRLQNLADRGAIARQLAVLARQTAAGLRGVQAYGRVAGGIR